MSNNAPEDGSPIDRDQAIEIARLTYRPKREAFEVFEQLPPGARLFRTFADEPCWFVRGPLASLGCGPSRLVVISKATGRVLYSGTDGGE